MHLLLSHEEINALLDESGESKRRSDLQLTIELDKHCLELKGFFNLYQDTVIELGVSLGKAYEIRSKGRIVAYGVLFALDDTLLLQVAHITDCKKSGEKE